MNTASDDHPVPLFESLLGEAWSRCPGAVRRLHTFTVERQLYGRCIVERGSGLLSNALAFLVRLPPACADVAVSVHMRRDRDRERWTRRFGEHVFASTMLIGRGRMRGLLCERIGLLNFAQALVVEGDRLSLVMKQWTAAGIRLPLWLAPRSNSYETEQDGHFRFHVELSHPMLGLIVRYRGWLTGVDTKPLLDHADLS